MEKSFGKMPKKTWMDNFKGSGSCALDLAKQSGLCNLSYGRKGTCLGFKEILYFHDVRR